jgi:DNA invertase Pin-like site-specific DNA recombinase
LDGVPVKADVMSAEVDWAIWFLVGALGGVVTVLSAVAIRTAYRQRCSASPQPPASAARSAVLYPREPASAAEATGTSSHRPPGKSVIGYVTIPAGPGGNHDGAAVAAIEHACARSAWRLVEIVEDLDEGPTLARPGLRSALERISEGHAQGLVVNDLERMGRSIVDLGTLMTWFRDADATLVALDLDIDTSTPEGQHVAATLIALSARDHERIARGTRRGLAKGRASGRPTGRPAVSHRPELVERIAAMRAANMTLSAIADQLNAEGIPTLRGGKKWRPSSIQSTLGYRRPGTRDRLPSPHAGA